MRRLFLPIAGTTKNLAVSRVITDLKIKGVHGEVIEKAVGSVYEEIDEEKQAREYLKRKRLKKPADQKQAARIFRQLVRAGFRSKTIFAILKKWDVEEEMLTALEGGSSGIGLTQYKLRIEVNCMFLRNARNSCLGSRAGDDVPPGS